MKVLTAAAMAAVDRRAIDEVGIPGLVLMENAALGVVEALVESFPEARSIALYCGPGNNGGDGLAVARHLDARGFEVRTFLLRGARSVTGDCATQKGICQRLGIPVEEIDPEGDWRGAAHAAVAADVVVDALFGTGLSRPLEGHFRSLVEALAESSTPVLAVDLPSGLDGSRGQILGPHLPAALTVTFGGLKVAHVLEPAAASCGRVAVADLGFPPWLVEEAEGDLHLLTPEEVAASSLPREVASHKGDHGHLLIVAGSPGKGGAAVLAAQAAVRGGAGLVTVAVPEPLLQQVEVGSVESMTVACAANGTGGLAGGALPQLRRALEGKSAAALGPGLAPAEDGSGDGEETFTVLRQLVLESGCPLVLDADGLNAFAGRGRELQQREGATVLTPHPGELARLLGITTTAIQEDRLAAARRGAQETGSIVVLKGHRTVIASPEGEAYLNPTGNAAMASGGSGDVLTGLLGALLAQGYQPLVAAQRAVYLHGLAGDLAVDERVGDVGGPAVGPALPAMQLAEALGAAFQALEGE